MKEFGKMRILYFTQFEVTHEDMYDILKKMGHQVKKVNREITNYCIDYAFSDWLQKELTNEEYDMVFSVYFIPLISKITHFYKLKYVTWIFDAMTLSMYSQMIFSPYNYIFTFDRKDYEILKQKGVKNVWHLPLAVNVERIKAQLRDDKYEELSDSVTFLGSLYTGKYDFFSQINNLPDYIKGYVDALVVSQLCMPGSELIRESVTSELVNELNQYVTIECLDEFLYTPEDVYIDMLLKKATITERETILEEISRKNKLTIFTDSDASNLQKAIIRGYADYYTEMPQIFYKSAINLNITHRAIQSGISLRVLDVMAAGGFLISNEQPELCELFVPNEEFVCYSNMQDLLEKIRYFLNNPDERKAIAQKGQEKVTKYYTYEIQFSKMFEIIKAH